MRTQTKGNKMKITERKNGTLRIEGIGTREYYGEGHYHEESPNVIQFVFDDENGYVGIVGLAEERDCRAGDEGCLVVCHDVSPDALRSSAPINYHVSIVDDIDGIGGNMHSEIKRLHGWRGTTNDTDCTAWGWRRVESVQPRKRGIGWVVILSEDLKQEEE